MYRWVVLFSLVSTAVWAHNPQRPDLDKWYSDLHRKGMAKCCDKSDCHRTEAEMRPDPDGLGKSHWWARIGQPNYKPDGSVPDWTLGPYVEIPDDIIVKDDQGRPIPNPEGEAVFCHVTGSMATIQTHLYCFVPPAQY